MRLSKLYIFSNKLFVISGLQYFKSLKMFKRVSVSKAEPKLISKNRLKSFEDVFAKPSAILFTIETAALLICELIP